MNFWEELEDLKFNDNEYLVDHLVEVIKDEGINSLEELKAYENKYFVDSNMTREDWIRYYQDSFMKFPELEGMDNDATALKIKSLRDEMLGTFDNNLKIKNIIMICALMEREFCFLVEAYNLILGGDIEIKDERLAPFFVPNKNVVLCGSMKVRDQLLKIADALRMMGYNPLLPEECLRGEPKNVASRAHFDRIANPDNYFVLIVNATKEGIDNYIGPNSFAEIAFGFYHNKKVLLLNDIYIPYQDEIIGWGVISLKGDLRGINNLI